MGTQYTGQVTIDPSVWTVEGGTYVFKLVATLQCSTAGITGQALLYNLTDTEAVTDGALTHTGDTAYYTATSAALTVGAAAGNLKSSAKVYEIRLSVSAGGSTSAHVVTMTQAYLLVTRS
jgi:hypothetical protein